MVLVGGAPLAARARGAKFLGIQQGSTAGVHSMCGLISPGRGRDCIKSLRSSYVGLYPHRFGDWGSGSSVTVTSKTLTLYTEF